jgi:uncharacterized membrane protein (DUF373 family)
VDAEEVYKEAMASAAQRRRITEFAILAVAVILVMRLIGAQPMLIIEIFGLAAILGISAVILILFVRRKPRFR